MILHCSLQFQIECKHDACALISVVIAGSTNPCCSCTVACPVCPLQPWPYLAFWVVQIGPVASGSAKPRLDSLEVYGKPRAEVAASAAAESRPPAAAQISTEAMLAAAANSVPSLISPTPSHWTGMEYLLSQALLTAQSLWDALQGRLLLQCYMFLPARGAKHSCLQMYAWLQCAQVLTCLASLHRQTSPLQQRLLSCSATSVSATWWHPCNIRHLRLA